MGCGFAHTNSNGDLGQRNAFYDPERERMSIRTNVRRDGNDIVELRRSLLAKDESSDNWRWPRRFGTMAAPRSVEEDS